MVTPTPSPTAVSARTGLTGFVGSWGQHAGQMTIARDGTIHLTYQADTGTYPPPFPNLTLRVTAVNDGVITAVVTTSDYPPIRIGAAFTLRLSDQGIVELTYPDRTVNQWCDKERFTEGRCGA